MVARLDRRRDLLRHQDRAHRQSAGDRLRQRQHVRLDAELLVGEQRPRSSEAALDLVEDERDVSLLRQRAHLAHEAGIEHAHAALALHWLEDQRRGGLPIDRDARGPRCRARRSRCPARAGGTARDTTGGPSRRACRTAGRGMRRAARRSRASRRHCVRAQRRANLNAPSLASAPELQKNTFDANDFSTSVRGQPFARLASRRDSRRESSPSAAACIAWRSPASP